SASAARMQATASAIDAVVIAIANAAMASSRNSQGMERPPPWIGHSLTAATSPGRRWPGAIARRSAPRRSQQRREQPRQRLGQALGEQRPAGSAPDPGGTGELALQVPSELASQRLVVEQYRHLEIEPEAAVVEVGAADQ